MTDFKFVFREEMDEEYCDLIVDIGEEELVIDLKFDNKVDKNTVFLIGGNSVNVDKFMDFIINYAEENPCKFYFDEKKQNYFQHIDNNFIINFVFDDCEIIRKEILIDSNETGSQIFKQLNYFCHWCKSMTIL
jgi:hypothetical protein